MEKEKQKNISRGLGVAIAIALIVVAVPIFQIVLGFTDPTGNPPTGNGKLAASGDNLSISSARLVDLASPVASTDAANKAYVDAQTGVGGGSGGGLVTLFGVSVGAPTAAGYLRPGGGLAACLRGLKGGSCNGLPPMPAGMSPGLGTPECSSLDNASTTWSELYAGYGPLNGIHAWYDNQYSTDRDNTVGINIEEVTTPDEVVAISDSICSTASFALIDNKNYTQNAGMIVHSASVVSACTTDDCNTCRVCIAN